MSATRSLPDILPNLKSHDPTSQSKAQAVLQFASLMQAGNDATRRELETYLDDLLKFKSKYALTFAIMTSLFHINVGIASEIFMGLSSQVHKFSSEDMLQDIAMTEWFLEMLSAACADKLCRTEVETKYVGLIDRALTDDSGSPSSKALAASILVKLAAIPKPPSSVQSSATDDSEGAGADVDALADMLRSFVVDQSGDSTTFANALEGLTYSSLNVSIKEMLIRDSDCLNALLGVLKEKSPTPAAPSVMYGVLTILSNISEYPALQTKEGAQIKKLRSYANAGKGAKDIEEKPEAITRRCKLLLDMNVISYLAACAPRATLNSQHCIGAILKALATEKKHRSLIVQQGGISVILSVLQPTSTSSSSSSSFNINAGSNTPNTAAISALAKLLISVNPSLAFSSRHSPAVAIRPLLSLIDANSEDGTVLDEFESLLALTNLASMDTKGVSDNIVSQGWPKIENLVLADNPMIQRAATELVCNLVATPAAAAKYLDKDDKSYKNRLNVLVALTDAVDVQTRSAAAGALAILSEWGPAGDVLAEGEKSLKGILRVLADEEDSGIVLRGAACLNNILCGATPETGAANKILKLGGLDAIKKALGRGTMDAQLIELLQDSMVRIKSAE
ncbi:armadillo-type protein [Lipomyces kononenkoae]|uniref:Armadillo-type protein n=1 Tax=Lipomyces kononenkoae TaxID=34357 RepID=A0ACC3TAF9_LIPKO